MNFLTKIIEYKKIEVEAQKLASTLSLKEMEVACNTSLPTISFIEKLKNATKSDKIALIAEVKKASPSKGLIRPDFNPVDIALEYQDAGASAISVLTDEKFFQGSISYLKNIRKVVNLPVLRKDFIIDPFQIYQTRLMGADMILLIASALEKNMLKDYFQMSKELGLEVLLETHDEQEFEVALEVGAKIIGINNRNLSTFNVDLQNTVNIIKEHSLADKYIISESGITNNDDVIYLKNNGVNGILVGESLMRKDDIKKAVLKLLS